MQFESLIDILRVYNFPVPEILPDDTNVREFIENLDLLRKIDQTRKFREEIDKQKAALEKLARKDLIYRWTSEVKLQVDPRVQSLDLPSLDLPQSTKDFFDF